MIELIHHFDEVSLHCIHITWANYLFDQIMPFFRNPYFWAPFYLFLLVYMWRNYSYIGLWWCVFFFITFVFCDFTSSSVLKPIVHRMRPCNDPNLYFNIRSLVQCGSGFSFPSSHAANHFGLAIYMIITLRHLSKMIMPLALCWAGLICYAQLYVGVHYPSDILGGALIGILIGWFFGRYFLYRYHKLEREIPKVISE